jgi:ABC-type branched-subunit amino acid transport system permease subunit
MSQHDPGIGRDEWVSRSGENVEPTLATRALIAFNRLPAAVRYAVIVVPIAILPFVTSDQYKLQVGLDTLVFVILALGLNVTLGWAGLLDLGYVAFFGFGAYVYAWLASDQFGIHWDAQWAVPAAVAATAALGLLLGLTSWRVSGDYFAIVTLFFLQIMLTLAINIDSPDFAFWEIPPEWHITNGPNGISTVDPLSFFGVELDSLDSYYFVAVGAIVLLLAAMYLVNNSRVGRGWRSQREDVLAAELMGMRVRWLKLSAFAYGAAVAGLAGPLLAASHGAVFPVDFDLTVLITVYAMVILGGLGSLAGVMLGAVVLNVALEVLREPSNASIVFFFVLLVVTLAVIRPLWLWAAVVMATLVFGLAVHAVVEQVWPEGVAGTTAGGTRLDELAEDWVILPADPITWNRIMFLVLIGGALSLTVLRGWRRLVAFPPVLYLAVCMWESAMLPQPAIARYILIGAMLIGLMAARPQGLLGTQRVEIV